MGAVTLSPRESQVIDLARQLSPEGKRVMPLRSRRSLARLQALIPEFDRLDNLVAYGDKRVRMLCKARGIDWDSLSEQERERLVDDWVHEQ